MKEPAVRRLLAALCSPLACRTNILEEPKILLSHSHSSRLKKKMFIWSFQASSPDYLQQKKLHLNDFSSSFPGRLCLCSHSTLHTFIKLGGEVWSKAFNFLLLNPFFDFIFFLICQSSLHRFTNFGNEVWSKAFYFGISIDFKLVCNVMSRPLKVELLDLKQWWLNLSKATTKMGHHHRVFWDILTHKDLSSTNSKKGNDWNKCIRCNNMNFV